MLHTCGCTSSRTLLEAEPDNLDAVTLLEHFEWSLKIAKLSTIKPMKSTRFTVRSFMF